MAIANIESDRSEAVAIAQALNITVTHVRNGGRYVNGETGFPGVYLWLTAKSGEDEIGIQFRGKHGPRAEREWAPDLLEVGLARRGSGEADRTYSHVVPRRRDREPDLVSLGQRKLLILQMLARSIARRSPRALPSPPLHEHSPANEDFVSFVRRTLAAPVELELPARDTGEIRPELF